MDAETLRDLYDSQLRAEAEVADADELVRIGPVWAATFPRRHRGFVTYRSIPEDADIDVLVSSVVAHYESDQRVDEFEWKTRGHDPIPRLMETLDEHGFIFEDVETVMAGDVQAAIDAEGPIPDGYVVGCATDAAEVREAEALAGRVFGDTPESSAQRGDALVRRLEESPGSFEMWFVRDAEGAVVCSGRIDFVDGTDFAGLWGGACDEAHRGRGLYRALTAARARSAQARGKRYLQSDCTEFSRPILERAGLVRVTTTTPAVWHRR